jgi:hypothetical protein
LLLSRFVLGHKPRQTGCAGHNRWLAKRYTAGTGGNQFLAMNGILESGRFRNVTRRLGRVLGQV